MSINQPYTWILVALTYIISISTGLVSGSAKARTIHRCESYRTTSGQTLYRVSPSIRGAYGIQGLPQTGSLIRCFVPVSGKKCFYKSTTQNTWRKCGENYSSGGSWRINYANGDGEIVEDPRGRRYHAFSFVNQFYFD